MQVNKHKPSLTYNISSLRPEQHGRDFVDDISYKV